jgi:hypothetical protein
MRSATGQARAWRVRDRRGSVVVALVGLLSVCGSSVRATGIPDIPVETVKFSRTDIQLLHGENYKLGDETHELMTLEHVSTWKYGSNFAFFDMIEVFDDGTTVYGEWYTWLNYEKVTGRQINFDIIDDVALGAAINAGDDYRAYIGGLTVYFKVPRFEVLSVDFMAFDERKDDDVTYIITPVWSTRFNLGPAKIWFRGFVDIIGPEGDRERQVLSEPQLLLDVGHFWGSSDKLYAGMEYHYWDNSFGIEGLDERVPQAMVMWIF